MARPDYFSGDYRIRGIEDAMKRATVSALNKFADRIIVLLKQKTVAKYNIHWKRAIDRRVSRTKASFINNRYSVTINVEGTAISLTEFNPKKGASGIIVEIIRGKPVEIKGTFLAKRVVGNLGNIGKTEVFKRKGTSRLPIRVTIGTKIQDMLRSRDMQESIKQKYDAEFAKLLISEFKFYYSKVK
jgi:hypothetical protein